MSDGAATVALAGATGFTGRRVAARLAARHGAVNVRCLVRPGSDRSVLPGGLACTVGDLADPESLGRWLDGADLLVYCASMGFGHVPGVLAELGRAGVPRAVFVSTTAIFTRLPAPSKAVRTAAEDAVRASPAATTIVRPTMIYGAPGDRNMERLLRALRRWPVFPLVGGGRGLIQPVHVEDLADGIVAACVDVARDREYDLSGALPITFRDAVRTAAQAAGTRSLLVPLPIGPVAWLLGAAERIGLRLPLKREQVLRLAEDKAFSHAAAAADLGFAPRGFEDGIAEEARLLGLVRDEGLSR